MIFYNHVLNRKAGVLGPALTRFLSYHIDTGKYLALPESRLYIRKNNPQPALPISQAQL